MDIPYGYCHCGCGEKTTVPDETNWPKNRIKGVPVRYRRGHSARRTPQQYVEEDRGYETPCWVWMRRKGRRDGYGRITICNEDGRRTWAAHRWVYEQHRGPIPEGLTLDHLCRVRECVNPDHLEPVTLKVNVQRGWAYRSWSGQPPANTVLTPEAVQEIKELLKEGRSLRSIGRQFGVTHGAIQGIARGTSWRHVT